MISKCALSFTVCNMIPARLKCIALDFTFSVLCLLVLLKNGTCFFTLYNPLLYIWGEKKRNYRAENLLAPVECDSPCHHKADMYWTEKWEMERARKTQKWWSRKKKREENLRLQQMCPLSSPISSVISSSALKMNCAWFLQCPYRSSRMTAVSINAKLPFHRLEKEIQITGVLGIFNANYDFINVPGSFSKIC